MNIERDVSNTISIILKLLQKQQVFSNKDLLEINLSINILFKEYVEMHIIDMKNPDFDTNLMEYIFDILSEQFLH